MIKTIVQRVTIIRNYHGFKRAIAPSDVDPSNKKWSKNHITNPKFRERGDKKGSDLYFPKYGASTYDAPTIYKSVIDPHEVKLTNTTNYKIGDNRSEYDDEYDATGNGRYD